MKITKSQLKQIIKEELSKVLNEDINTASPIEVLKQMIYTKVPGKEFGYKIASPENVQDYLEWIQAGKDPDSAVGAVYEAGIKELQQALAYAVKEVIPKVQNAVRQGKDFDLPTALGISGEDPKFQHSPTGHLYGPLGDPYTDISPSKWLEDLSRRSLFGDLIEMFKKYYDRYIEPDSEGTYV